MLIELNDFLWENRGKLDSQTVVERVVTDSEKLNEFSLKINKEQSD